MAKTRKAIEFDHQVRDAYCDDESQIKINRAFAQRILDIFRSVPEIKYLPEAGQLETLIVKNRERVKSKCANTLSRPLIS